MGASKIGRGQVKDDTVCLQEDVLELDERQDGIMTFTEEPGGQRPTRQMPEGAQGELKAGTGKY